MSYLTGEMRKQVVMIQTCCYHIGQIAKQEFENCLGGDNPNTDANVTRLTQIGNITEICRLIHNWVGNIGLCIKIINDMEKELEK